MRKLTTVEKAQKLVREEGVFKVNESDQYEYYNVKGSNQVYEITLDKYKNSWNCTCKNIRMNDCYHILAVKLLKQQK